MNIDFVLSARLDFFKKYGVFVV